MRAFVVAAGRGTRMRPLTENVPKPLLPVAGRPFMEHILVALAEVGITEVAILIGWNGHRVRAAFGDGAGLGLTITYVEQLAQRGTADAVGHCPWTEEDFLCINGDVLVSPDTLQSLLGLAAGTCAIVGARVADASRYGALDVFEDLLQGIREKQADAGAGLINAGIYRFPPTIHQAIAATEPSPRGELEVTDSILMLDGVHVVPAHGPWIDAGRPWDLLEVNQVLLDRMRPEVLGDVEPGAVLKGAVHVGKGAVVRAGSYIQGPVYIGDGADIGPNCHIRAHTSIGRDCHVGAASEVKNSILGDRSKAPHHNYIGDSVIGEQCNLGSGTKVANLRHDDANVKVVLQGERIDTGRRKLGVILGDRVKTGINSSLEPGAILGGGTLVGAGARVKGTHAAGSRIH